jgi:hypothetical protein
MGEKQLGIGTLMLSGLFLSLFIGGCAEVHLNTIPAPSPTAKLRVFVLPISTGTGWTTPEEEYAQSMMTGMQRYFERIKIYEIVPTEDLKLVLGQSWSAQDWMGRWSKNHWELARNVGRALHAEYGVFTERSRREKYFSFRMVLVNVKSGREFDVWMPVPGGGSAPQYEEIIRISYQEIFQQAQEDMLVTAILKGRATAPASPAKASSPPERRAPPGEIQSLPGKPGPPIDLEKIRRTEALAARKPRLAVYDFSTREPFKVIALILSEALREEIFRMGDFSLVNRENIAKVLGEMELQQSGLVDERQAVRAGKGLAASQIVLGQFGVVGNISILQVKRIDVETQATLGVDSLRCAQGREEELLAGIGELARRLGKER